MKSVMSNDKVKPVVELAWHETLYRLIESGVRMICLVGEPGVGKTFFARHAAKSLRGSEPICVSGSPELDLSSLWGRWALERGETIFRDGPLTSTLKGGTSGRSRVLLIEDLGLIPIETRLALLGLDQDNMECPFTYQVYSVPNDILLICTSNPETISSCRRNSGMSTIFFDRFHLVMVDEPQPRHWREMLDYEFPTLAPATRDRAIELFQDWRDFSSHDSSTRKFLTFRSLKRLAGLLLAGFDELEAIELAIINALLPNDRDLAEGARLKLEMTRPSTPERASDQPF